MDASTRNLLIAVQFCFGVFPVLGKQAMQVFEPRAVLVWRLLVGSAVLAFVAWRMHPRRFWLPRRDLAVVFGLSLLGITVNQLLFLEGLTRSTATNAGLLMTVIPVATVGLGLLFRQERATWRRLLGIALSVGGVAWLFLGRGAELSASTRTGDLLMTANAISYSGYLVAARSVLRRLPQVVVLAWMFVFGALLVPWFSLGVDWAPAEAAPIHWWALAGILLFPTVLAYIGNIVVLARAGAAVTAAYVMLQPFLAAGLGIGLLGEPAEAALIPAALGVLSGLWLVSATPRGAPRLSTTR